MEPTQYIRQQLAAGHSEATIRNHMLAYGWQSAAIDRAFAAYHASASTHMAHAPVLPQRKQKWFILGGILLIVVIAVAVTLAIPSRKSPPTAISETQKLEVSSLQNNAQNTSRKNDVSKLAGVAAQFMSNNDGAVPTQVVPSSTANSIEFCSGSCSTSQPASATLDFYQPGNVVFKSYSVDLAVPNANTVYVISGATCQQGGNGLGEQVSNPRALVFLYALQSNGTQQRCLSL